VTDETADSQHLSRAPAPVERGPWAGGYRLSRLMPSSRADSDLATTGPKRAPSGEARDVRLISELERLLRKPGCPVCRTVEESERSFFSWFQIESFTAAEVQARLRAGMGMCPRHSRRLVDDLGEGDGHIMTTVMRHALAGARQILRDRGQPGPCPACEAVAFGAQRGRSVLLEGLSDPRHARLYSDHDGICLRHLLHAAEVADRSALRLLAERLAASLEKRDGSALVSVIAGVDRDAGRRGDWRERLPDPPGDGSTVARLCRQLEQEACPVCLARGQANRRYVHWFVERASERDPSLETDPGQLCAPHLHDIAVVDEGGAASAAGRQRAARLAQLHQLLDRLDHSTPPARRGRRRADEDLVPGCDELTSMEHCPACHARDGVERAQLALVNSALALRPVRDRYEQTHGLCVRHALQIPEGRASEVAHRHSDARVAVLAWEVEETGRKYAWAYRHEPSGPETDAWIRAMGQIDGQAFEGAPPATHLALARESTTATPS